jgi:hypothetical protein
MLFCLGGTIVQPDSYRFFSGHRYVLLRKIAVCAPWFKVHSISASITTHFPVHQIEAGPAMALLFLHLHLVLRYYKKNSCLLFISITILTAQTI